MGHPPYRCMGWQLVRYVWMSRNVCPTTHGSHEFRGTLFSNTKLAANRLILAFAHLERIMAHKLSQGVQKGPS